MKPIFETKLSIVDYLLGGIQIVFGIAGIIYIVFGITKANWGGQLFLISFFLIFLIQGVRTTKTFLLYNDRLVVRRPLTFNLKTDVIFKISDIKKVTFRSIQGRFGGPHMLIYAKTRDKSYRISFSSETLQIFVESLSELAIEVENENNQ